MATDLANLTREQIDCLLRMHVRDRATSQQVLVTVLDDIDHHTQRIEQLMDARAKAPA